MTVLFDGACGLCRPVVSVLRRLDLRRSVEFLDLQCDWPAIQRRFPALSRDAWPDRDARHRSARSRVHGFSDVPRARLGPPGWLAPVAGAVSAGRALARPEGLSRDCGLSSRGDPRRPTAGSWVRRAGFPGYCWVMPARQLSEVHPAPPVGKPAVRVPQPRGDTAAEREAQADRVIRREKRNSTPCTTMGMSYCQMATCPQLPRPPLPYARHDSGRGDSNGAARCPVAGGEAGTV